MAYNFMTGRMDEDGRMLPSLDAADSPLDLMDPGQAAPAATAGDANGNGVPDVLERTTTIKEKFAPRGGAPGTGADRTQSRQDAGGGTMAATLPGGARMIATGGSEGRIASFSPEEQQQAGALKGGFGPYARRFMAEGSPLNSGSVVQFSTPQEQAARGQQEGLARAYLLSRPDPGNSVMSGEAARMREGMGIDGPEAFRWGAPGLTRQERMRRSIMATSPTGLQQFEQGNAQFNAGLRNALDVARATGRFRMMGERSQADATTRAAQIKADAEARAGAEERLFKGQQPIVAGNRVIDPRTGAEMAPEQRPAAGLQETPVKGWFVFTDASGKQQMIDMRERQAAGSFDAMRYMQMADKDPTAAQDYLFGRGAYAPQQAAPEGAGAAQAQGPSGGGKFQEGQTATGPNGERMVFRDGRWQKM